MGNNPSMFKGDMQCPVENVSWNDCQEFIKKLNGITGKNFRLPTEAEWEYAARGGNKSRGYKYSGSDNIGDVAWCNSNSNDKTHPVKTKKANELGIYDMSGNVWEFCHDWYDGTYYSPLPQNNPKGPRFGSFRVIRGGCWGSDGQCCRVAYRSYYYPCDEYYYYSGLRLAL
jgi:formylglycine-generating enzyme required for sulfatase activity